MVTRSTALEVSAAELLAALHDAFVEELGDEELASLAVEALVEERLLAGEWTFAPSIDLGGSIREEASSVAGRRRPTRR